jgi:DNA-binding MarR family transcriptional regulator/GNAT superfamily N-acetyltransferase
MEEKLVAELRAFNRFYTRVLGLLDEHIVDSPFSLAEARVLYEISTLGHTTAADLSRSLGLDPGYLSRMLRRLVGAEYIIVTPGVTDRRQNSMALSDDGDIAVANLGERSDASVGALVETLDENQQHTLLRAARDIRRILGDSLPQRPVLLRPHRIGELGWLIHRQAVLYNRQFGWNGEFETLIARIYHEYEIAPASPPKSLWVAERDGEVMGSIFVTPAAGRPGTAQLRMLYVEPEARGLGIGTSLVGQCVAFSREAGYQTLRLWTQSVLESARRIYAAAGFEMVESAPHHSFGHDLNGEYWELALQ